ncbi:MAG TPA: SLATT domain-containing protein, partial [Allocoleopsis sp.]
VAVSGALTAALTSFLEFKRVEATLIGYNQAADSLYDIRTLWLSLSEHERKLDLLVKTTEEIIQSENASWLQDMQDRLADLYSQVKPDEESEREKPALEKSELEKPALEKPEREKPERHQSEPHQPNPHQPNPHQLNPHQPEPHKSETPQKP